MTSLCTNTTWNSMTNRANAIEMITWLEMESHNYGHSYGMKETALGKEILILVAWRKGRWRFND